jgi:H+-transporting ATPase
MDQATVPLVENDYGGDYTAMEMGGEGRPSARPSRVSRPTRSTMSGRVTVNRATVGPSSRITQHDADMLNRATTTAGNPMAGLTSQEAARRLEEYGKNEVEEAEVSIVAMFFKQFYGMMPFCIAVCFILAIIAADYIDTLFIGSLLFINAIVGFREEYEAYTALQELRDTDIKTCRVKRDGRIYTELAPTGETIGLPVEMLVPGDVISIKIGDVIPADCKIVEGEIKMDTKAITGEPLPWRVPRPTKAEPPNPGSNIKPDGYAKDEKGSELWGGCPVTQGECHAEVIRTGANTIIGEVTAILNSKEVGRKSDFEMKILLSVKIIISFALVISILMALVQTLVRDLNYQIGLKALVALLIGSVPVALPLVLLVTMAMGSVIMSNEKALVSDLAALQDIASMTCLNSDKTGTLTTAIMDIIIPSIHAEPGFNSDEILEMAAVCSNRANADDAIDGAIIRAFDKTQGGSENGERHIAANWTVVSTKGFNNAAKRVECTATNKKTGQTVMIVKGLITKILKNNSQSLADIAEDEDNSHTRFECKDYANVKDRIEEIDLNLATDGYKTIGLGIRKSPESPVEFIGIVPMLDPPRDDAPLCIQMIREAGVNVKMVTGDHQNIAKTTAGILGLGTNILPNTAFAETSGAMLNDMVLKADGFAQVMPKDKERVVVEEQAAGWIVGFCGDGMNDALALNQAQVGIAVADAMDAAITASAIQLLDPGLQCIYTAIVESRKIFRRVKAYVTYRFAATIQVIVFLSVVLFVSGCQIDLIYIVILALLNDLTMLPLSNDKQKASIVPDNPVVSKLLLQSFTFGIIQASLSVTWFYVANGNFLDTQTDSHHLQPVTWFNYLNSKGGEDGAFMNKLYHTCEAALCPGYSCKTKADGAELLPKCSMNLANSLPVKNTGTGYADGAAADDQPYCWPEFQHTSSDPQIPLSGLNNNGPADFQTAYSTFTDEFPCPKTRGSYEHASLPVWQECCVEYSGLKHPGQPHYGTVDSVCTEIATSSVFVQILVASELMIFPVRALGWMWTNQASTSLYISIVLSIIVFSILPALGVPKDFGPLGDIFAQKLGFKNTAIAWAFSFGATLLIDIVKFWWVTTVDGTTEEIVHERVADRFATEKAAAFEASRRDTAATAGRRTEATMRSTRADAILSSVSRPSTRMTVGNALISGPTDPRSLGAALSRANRQVRLSYMNRATAF